MTPPRQSPPGAYLDDPAQRLDSSSREHDTAVLLAGETLRWIFDWIIQDDVSQRSLRADLVALCLFPQLLPCRCPSALWCARIHGVSHEWANRLRRDFLRQFKGRLRLREYRLTANRPPRPRD